MYKACKLQVGANLIINNTQKFFTKRLDSERLISNRINFTPKLREQWDVGASAQTAQICYTYCAFAKIREPMTPEKRRWEKRPVCENNVLVQTNFLTPIARIPREYCSTVMWYCWCVAGIKCTLENIVNYRNVCCTSGKLLTVKQRTFKYFPCPPRQQVQNK